MARLARLVVPGLPHHITQRGTRRQPVFFQAADYDAYRTLLAQACARAVVQVWNSGDSIRNSVTEDPSGSR